MSHRNDATTQRPDRYFLNQTETIILGTAIVVHSKLGPGLRESVYRTSETAAGTPGATPVISEAPRQTFGLRINFKVPYVMQGVQRIVNDF